MRLRGKPRRGTTDERCEDASRESARMGARERQQDKAQGTQRMQLLAVVKQGGGGAPQPMAEEDELRRKGCVRKVRSKRGQGARGARGVLWYFLVNATSWT